MLLKALMKNKLVTSGALVLSCCLGYSSAWAASPTLAENSERPANPTPVSVSNKSFEYDRAALLKALEVMDARRCEVQTLMSSLNIVIIDNVTGKKQGLEGWYFGDANGNFRMRINWQEATIIDLSFIGDDVTLFLPKKERYYKGKKKDLLEAKACALSLLANAGNAHDLFFPRAWTPHAVGRRLAFEDGIEVVKVIEKNNPSGPKEEERLSRKVFITKDSPSASMIEVFDAHKNAQGNIRYGPYKNLPVEGHSNVDLAYPATVTLTQADGSRSLQMEIKELDLNIPIEEKKFVIAQPEDMKTLDLGDCLKSGKNPWE